MGNDNRLTNEGRELMAKAVAHEFATAFPDMKYVDIEAAYGGYPVAEVSFDATDSVRSFVVRLALSGAERDDVKVSFARGCMEVSYDPKRDAPWREKSSRTLYNKIKNSRFLRSYPVPSDMDFGQADVSLVNGMLVVAMFGWTAAKCLEVAVRDKPVTEVVAVLEGEGGRDGQA